MISHSWFSRQPSRSKPARGNGFRPGVELLEDRLAPATLPTGFAESIVASGMTASTAMAMLPDGRLFITEQAGTMEVFHNGTRQQENFFRDTPLSVNSTGERGLLGIAIDPNFTSNRFVYVYYTATSPAIHNRVSRFTANAAGNLALAGSEFILLELPNLGATNHNGGALHFGPDGKLYVAVGDNAVGSNSQNLSNRLGKILRINKNGTDPSDNPFFNTPGADDSIWAIGLRNPFTFAFQPGTGRMFINDVGSQTWEEINDGVAAGNYGWPDTEGPTTNPNFITPFHAYDHDEGIAITGGAFYNPDVTHFPSQYVGDYFFADFGGNWIRRIDLSTKNVIDFATGISAPVDLMVDAAGNLYYLQRGGGGRVFRVQYTANQAPSISQDPADQTVSEGQSVTFTVNANGTAPLQYQWQRNGADINGATAASYTIASAALADNGDTFRAIVSNSFGSATSQAATLTVTSNQAPVPTITAPATGTLYRAGNTIAYSGTGADPQDGNLPASAFTWDIVFHHDDHTHPFTQKIGAKTGSFKIPTTGETSANVFYRIHLTVRDSGGLTTTTFVDVQPRTADITLDSRPAGVGLKLDDQPVTAPTTFEGVVGMTRKLEAPASLTINDSPYFFKSWSDGGGRIHTIKTPDADTTYTAVLAPISASMTAWWEFNESSGATAAADSIGGNTATLVNGPVFAPSDETIGNALTFDGINDYARVTDAAVLDGSDRLTISLWVNPALLDGQSRGVLGKRVSSASNYSYGLHFIDGRLQVDLVGTDDRFTSNTVFQTNTWYHIAVTFDGRSVASQRAKLYVNGVLDKKSTESAAAIPDNASNLVFGALDAGEAFKFAGRLDDIRIYKKTMSQADIQAVMTSGAAPSTTTTAAFTTGADNNRASPSTGPSSAAFSSGLFSQLNAEGESNPNNPPGPSLKPTLVPPAIFSEASLPITGSESAVTSAEAAGVTADLNQETLLWIISQEKNVAASL